jgi:hypothetical protein
MATTMGTGTAGTVGADDENAFAHVRQILEVMRTPASQAGLRYRRRPYCAALSIPLPSSWSK